MQDSSKLYTVVSRFGLSGAPDDVEAILVDNVITDPTHALNSIVWPAAATMAQKVQRPGLAGVVYFTKYDEAAQIAAALGPHRDGALVSVQAHDREADYIWRHNSPILECGAPVVYAIDEAIAFMAAAEGAGKPGRTASGLSSLGWRHFGPLSMEKAQELLRDGEAARVWLAGAAARADDEAFRAQAEAPGFYVNPETDYRMASDLEIVEAPATTHAPNWNFKLERTETLCLEAGEIGIPVTCAECLRIMAEGAETTRREHAAERALDQLA